LTGLFRRIAIPSGKLPFARAGGTLANGMIPRPGAGWPLRNRRPYAEGFLLGHRSGHYFTNGVVFR